VTNQELNEAITNTLEMIGRTGTAYPHHQVLQTHFAALLGEREKRAVAAQSDITSSDKHGE
jgi:hypothetical protein